MTNNFSGWKKLFLFCLGLFIASGLAMKWIERELIYHGEPISIIRLEIYDSKERIISIFSGIDDKVKTLLKYHLSFDFIFMAGCFPGIASLCMMAAEKTIGKWLRKFLLVTAFLQLFAWAFDITENYYLLIWLKDPVIGDEFGFFHFVVYCKWSIALLGFLFPLIIFVGLLFKRKIRNR